MSKLRAKENHPISKKVEQLFDCLDSLGLKIMVNRYGEVTIQELGDGQTEPVEWELRDQDDGRAVQDMPPIMEYKLVREATEEDELNHLRKLLAK